METRNADLSSLKISRTEDPQSHSSKKKIVVWVAILIAILSVGYFSINLLLEKTIEVKLITVEFQSASQSNTILTASGYVVAQRKASVASKGTGRLVYIGVDFHGTSSMSISMMRTLGSVAHRVALMWDDRWL